MVVIFNNIATLKSSFFFNQYFPIRLINHATQHISKAWVKYLKRPPISNRTDAENTSSIVCSINVIIIPASDMLSAMVFTIHNNVWDLKFHMHMKIREFGF